MSQRNAEKVVHAFASSRLGYTRDQISLRLASP